MNDAGAARAEPCRDLARAHKVVGVDLPAHATTLGKRDEELIACVDSNAAVRSMTRPLVASSLPDWETGAFRGGWNLEVSQVGADEQVEVVRAHRFEVVDDRERVRAVFGRWPAVDSTGEMVGFELYDRVGSARAWMLDEAGAGVRLAFAIGGNQVVVVEANDVGTEVSPGVAIILCESDGAPVLAWRVSPDGDVSAPPSPS